MNHDTQLEYYHTRHLYLTDTHLDSDDEAMEFCRKLVELNVRDTKSPIVLVVNSNGGYASFLFSIVDIMQAIEAPVYTQVLGYACSSAAYIAAAGERGHRYMTPRSRMMIHQPQNEMSGPLESMRVILNETQRSADIIIDLLLDITQTTDRTRIIENLRSDVWMSASEAIAYGLCDHIGFAPEFMSFTFPEDDCDE